MWYGQDREKSCLENEILLLVILGDKYRQVAVVFPSWVLNSFLEHFGRQDFNDDTDTSGLISQMKEH